MGIDCFEIDLSKLLMVSMLNSTKFETETVHFSRKIEEYILYAVIDGSLSLSQDGEHMELLPGDVHIFKKGCYQEGVDPCVCKFFYLHFESEGIKQMVLQKDELTKRIKNRLSALIKAQPNSYEAYENMKLYIPHHIHVADNALFSYILSMLKGIILDGAHSNIAERIKASYNAVDILLNLEKIALEALEGNKKGKSSFKYGTVARIVEYVNANFCKNIDSSAIEKHLHINFDYANRLFKSYTGYSIVKYRNILRLNKAKSELTLTKRSIADIAEELGFGSAYYFSRYFKKEEGISPKFFRESRGGEL